MFVEFRNANVNRESYDSCGYRFESLKHNCLSCIYLLKSRYATGSTWGDLGAPLGAACITLLSDGISYWKLFSLLSLPPPPEDTFVAPGSDHPHPSVLHFCFEAAVSLPSPSSASYCVIDVPNSITAIAFTCSYCFIDKPSSITAIAFTCSYCFIDMPSSINATTLFMSVRKKTNQTRKISIL